MMETKHIIKERTKIKIAQPKMYKVVMHNDDYTTMEFVIEVLTSIFNKKTEQANKIMIDVHKQGSGIAGIYPYDLAMTKTGTAMTWAKEEGFPFKLTVEEA